MEVYEYLINNDKYSVEKCSSTLALPLTGEEKELLVTEYGKYCETTFSNNSVLRLEDIDYVDNEVKIKVSYTDFYDFIITNVILKEIDKFSEFVQKVWTNKDLLRIIATLEEQVLRSVEYSGLQEMVSVKSLANTLAVSILLIDANNDILLVERSNNVAIGKGLYSVSTTGTVHVSDYDSEDPIKTCAVREIKNKLGLDVKQEYLSVKAVVAGKYKLQPVAIITGNLPYTFAEYKTLLTKTDMKPDCIKKIIVGSVAKVSEFIESIQMTEASRYHLATVIGD